MNLGAFLTTRRGAVVAVAVVVLAGFGFAPWVAEVRALDSVRDLTPIPVPVMLLPCHPTVAEEDPLLPRDGDALFIPASDTAGGFVFATRDAEAPDAVSAAVQANGLFDAAQTATLQTLIRRARQHRPTGKVVVMDIGAGLGWFSMVSAAAGAVVLAAEPIATNARFLEATLRKNHELACQIELHRYVMDSRDRALRAQAPSAARGDPRRGRAAEWRHRSVAPAPRRLL